MRAFERPLESLLGEAELFVSSPETRILEVTTSAPLRLATLQVLAGFEYHPLNRSPWFFFESTDDSLGWDSRAEELELQWLRRSDDEAEPPLPLLSLDEPEAADEHPTTGIDRFIQRLARAAGSLPSPLEGVVVVLSPARLREPLRWGRELRRLLLDERVALVRYVIVDLDRPVSRSALAGMHVRQADLQVDVDAVTAEQRARVLSAIEAYESHSSSSGLQFSGAWGAGPGVSPPPRLDRPLSTPGATLAAMKAGDIPSKLAAGGALEAANLLALQAGLAFIDGRAVDAAELQAAARDRMDSTGLFAEAGLLQLMLGVFLHQVGAAAEADQALTEVIQRASGLDDHRLSCLAHMGLAAIRMTQGRMSEAAALWWQVGLAGEGAEDWTLAVEGWRMAGEAYEVLGQGTEAWTARRRAVELALAHGEVAPQTTAAEAALALARTAEASGNVDIGAAWREQAELVPEPQE